MNINQNNNQDIWKDELSKYFENTPNKLILHNFYTGIDFLEKISSEEVNTVIEIIPDSNEDYVNQSSLHKINDQIYISFIELDKMTENYLVSEVIFYFEENLDEVQKIVEELDKFKVNIESNENRLDKFNSISVLSEKMIIQNIQIENSNFEIEDLYNEDIVKSIKNLKFKIKDSKKGLTIFYGENGTGKTEMVKYLVNNIDKSCLFIPSNTLDLTINNPEFVNFLKNYQDVILFIDDCEFFTNGKFSKMNYVTNNLVQLLDSIISDTLNLHILLVFNVLDEEEIDENLLDSNSLLGIIEFGDLDVDLSIHLSKKLGFNKKYKTNQRLVDIFNNRKEDKKNKIGL